MGKKIQTGDIIIFDGGDNWISKTICWLTRSTVSHAAMVYEEGAIVEMGMNGIAASTFEAEDGTDAHIMRLKGNRPLAPLSAAARHYIDDGISYDFPALILLAGLLIYKEVRPTPRWRKITDTVLLLACLAADKLLNEIVQKGSGKKAMVCSQLVYQIYLDCGKEYVIEIGKLLEAPEQARNTCGFITLAELMDSAKGLERNSEKALFEANPEAFLETDMEALSYELYEALKEAETGEPGDFAAGELSGLLDKASAFLDKMEQLLEQLHLDIPVPALFITPADLYQRAANLEHAGDFHLNCVKGN